MSETIGIVVSLALAAVVSGAMVWLGSVLGKKNPNPAKMGPFECGNDPISLPMGRQGVRFYLTAILFILFDVEIVFLYPWAVAFRSLGGPGLVGMGVFLGILMVGFFYAWNNGALDWS